MRKKDPKKELAIIGIGEVPAGWFPNRPVMTVATDDAHSILSPNSLRNSTIPPLLGNFF